MLMKNLIRVLTIALFGLAAGLSEAKLNVVTTLPDLGALAREIGGDKVDVTTLAKPTEDSHFVDARPPSPGSASKRRTFGTTDRLPGRSG